VVVAVCRWTVRLAEHGWGETVLPLPEGTWHDWITGQRWSGSVPASDLFANMPVALLERLDD
jgi:(1->4)-alpha-D-glucan 1-alpha-D-glucosylmutase